MKSLIFIFIVFYCLSAQTASSKKEESVSNSESIQTEDKKPALVTSGNPQDTTKSTAVKNATEKKKEKATVANDAVKKASASNKQKETETAKVVIKEATLEVKEKAAVKSDTVKATAISNKKKETETAKAVVKEATLEVKEKAAVKSDTVKATTISTTSLLSTDQEEKRGMGSFKEAIASVDPSVELGLEYPLSFGAHGKFHVSDSIYTRLGVGFASELLVTAFAKIAPSLGYLNRQEANLISDVIQNSFFGAWRLGWMPYTKKFGGPYMELGLLYLTFGQGETSGTVLNAAIETDLSQVGSNRYSVRSDLLNGTFHVGYQIPIEKNIHLNLELGVLKILYVNFKKDKSTASGVVSLPEEHHKNFKNFLVDKGWIFPTLSAWLGFSF